MKLLPIAVKSSALVLHESGDVSDSDNINLIAVKCIWTEY